MKRLTQSRASNWVNDVISRCRWVIISHRPVFVPTIHFTISSFFFGVSQNSVHWMMCTWRRVQRRRFIGADSVAFYVSYLLFFLFFLFSIWFHFIWQGCHTDSPDWVVAAVIVRRFLLVYLFLVRGQQEFPQLLLLFMLSQSPNFHPNVQKVADSKGTIEQQRLAISNYYQMIEIINSEFYEIFKNRKCLKMYRKFVKILIENRT